MDTLELGERYASRAIELDSTLGQAHHALGYVRCKQGDFAAAVREFKQAAERDHTIDAIWMLGFFLAEFEPGQPILLWWLDQSLAQAGRGEEARGVFEKAVAAKAVLISDMCALYCLAVEGDRSGVQKKLDASTLQRYRFIAGHSSYLSNLSSDLLSRSFQS